ncbi:DNA-cytosine methyltransferase (EC 2.1.1.37) [Rhodoferax lithotrophicus]|uniref:DNA-cytosine methyltransferase n=1 Tax=Rhodoferax lithotrophicus TaxID=2798804 RepID=A0ABN6D4W4_9BURK|nr:DNA-cytosine methyltransferase (EC 2.1.1.37) [Rhodoferax sp. MIZ03]
MIQTFPLEFQFPGCKSDVEQVIGNAVPVKLAEYVGSRLMQYIHTLEANNALPAPCQLFETKI